MTSIRLMHGIAPKLSLQRELGQKLMYNLHQFTQKCIVRFVAKGVGQEHKRFCPTTRNLCIACFGTNHRSKECTSMVVSTIAEICPKYFLPNVIGDVVFHSCGYGKNWIAPDVLKFFWIGSGEIWGY